MPGPVILSDIGNVLVSFDFSIAARRLAERSQFPAETVLRQLDEIKLPFEDGRMTDAEFVERAINLIGFSGTSAEFETIWCEIFAENTPMATSLAPYANRVPLLLLSNTSGIHKDYLLRSFGIFRYFQDGVYSYSARSSKPEEPIFRHVIERFDLDPAQTFYIDDLAPNIATAQRLGFVTHLYDMKQHQAFEQALASWSQQHGLLPLTPPVDAIAKVS